ncbi:hypothetical protein [Halarcobacter anaerophilus]|uniref:Uncharacterized protein n=1 Tax=Halarcobacter anaerophilus TaxID=877500 RepID=A0A4Q0Y0Y0_9BACT|nr:hypothetical protein [Halarcobacter anaerophilus]QDF28997.1 hypothetical protein AANAER_1517 [Halarcobacter anaerophilus]RXJ63632.1 hypothetical protein CRV06_05410 [Halarcobacter anaerophilus]
MEEQSFIQNVNAVAAQLGVLINLNNNMSKIALEPAEVTAIIEVKKQLDEILLVTQKEESVSLKHQEVLINAQAVLSQYNTILNLKQQIDTEHNEVLQKHSEVVTLAQQVNLKNSEIKNLSVVLLLLDENEAPYQDYNAISGKLTIAIPRGKTGDKGDEFRIDEYGLASEQSDYDGMSKGFSFFAMDSELLYFKLSGTTADWSGGISFGKGAKGDDLEISSIDDNGDGTFTWHFSDGTDYLTPSLEGAKGDKGDAPEHEWVGSTAIRFKNPDGTWGDTVDVGAVIADEQDMNYTLNLTGAI